jgi:hypothetical protein
MPENNDYWARSYWAGAYWGGGYWSSSVASPKLKIRIHSDEFGKLSVTHNPIVLLKFRSEDAPKSRTVGEDA